MPSTSSDDQKNQDDQSQELRQGLNDAYAFVKGQESVQTFAAITVEELIDQQISRIIDPGTDLRPNEMDRVDKILSTVSAVITKVKSLPDDAFAAHDPDKDANTAPSPTNQE